LVVLAIAVDDDADDEKEEEEGEEADLVLNRVEIIDQELLIRGLSSMGNVHSKVQRLRRAIASEKESMENEEKELQELLEFIESLSDEEARIRLEKEIARLTRQSIQSVSTQFGLELSLDGDCDTLIARLKLCKEVEKRTHLLSTEVDPEELTSQQLETELLLRRLVVPAKDQQGEAERKSVMVNRLSQALIEDQAKASLRFFAFLVPPSVCPFAEIALSLSTIERDMSLGLDTLERKCWER